MVRQEIEKDPKRTEIKDRWYNDEIADALRKSAWRTRSPLLYNVRIADNLPIESADHLKLSSAKLVYSRRKAVIGWMFKARRAGM